MSGGGNWGSHVFQCVFRNVTTRSAVHQHRRLGRNGCLHLYGWSSIPLLFKLCWDRSIFTGSTQVAFDLLHIWSGDSCEDSRVVWHTYAVFLEEPVSRSFSDYSCGKINGSGDFSFVMSGRQLRWFSGVILIMMSWSDVGLFYCAAFLTAFSTVGQKLEINIHTIRQCDSELVFFRQWQAVCKGGQFTAWETQETTVFDYRTALPQSLIHVK